MDDYEKLIKMSLQAQFNYEQKIYDEEYFNRLIDLMYYYKTCICFDYSNQIYNYCSETNIKKFHNIELIFKQIIELIENNNNHIYVTLLEYFIQLSKQIINYLDNFNKNQNNITILINKIKYLKIN